MIIPEAKVNKIDPNISQRAAANPKDSVWVAASAGTGKTKVLSDRVLNLLLQGCPPEKILCLRCLVLLSFALMRTSTKISN